jgi:hypothetical protein
MPSGDNALQPLRTAAVMTIRGSWQHLGMTVVLFAAILGWYVSMDAPTSAFAVVGFIGFFLVVYNLARIAQARKALREPARLVGFTAAQRRSHLVRRHLFVTTAPVLVGVTWIGMLSSAHCPPGEWVVLLAITLFLFEGWIRWRRVLRRLAAA